MSESMRVAQLERQLKCFVEPSTASASAGWVGPGNFELLEERPNFPDAQTDYLRIQAPETKAGEAWICSRWQDNTYATVAEMGVSMDDGPAPVPAEESKPAPAPAADAMTIDEQRLTARLGDFKGFTYSLTEGKYYPYPLPGIDVATNGTLNNCCTFVEGLVVRAFADGLGDALTWNMVRHRQAMIIGDDLFSPVTALVDAGIAVQVDADAPPPRWTVIQGWRGMDPPKGGHTFILLDYDPNTDKILTLESNSAFGLDGVGFRGIGMAENFDFRPPAQWFEMKGPWTWTKIKDTYKFRHMAQLKVQNISWLPSLV